MLANLRAELVRKGFTNPAEAIEAALGCTPKTARKKLTGESGVTLGEIVKIREMYFAEDHFTFEYLFGEEDTTEETDESLTKEAVELFRQLTPEDQIQMLRIVKEMVEANV